MCDYVLRLRESCVCDIFYTPTHSIVKSSIILVAIFFIPTVLAFVVALPMAPTIEMLIPILSGWCSGRWSALTLHVVHLVHHLLYHLHFMLQRLEGEIRDRRRSTIGR